MQSVVSQLPNVLKNVLFWEVKAKKLSDLIH